MKAGSERLTVVTPQGWGAIGPRRGPEIRLPNLSPHLPTASHRATASCPIGPAGLGPPLSSRVALRPAAPTTARISSSGDFKFLSRALYPHAPLIVRHVSSGRLEATPALLKPAELSPGRSCANI